MVSCCGITVSLERVLLHLIDRYLIHNRVLVRDVVFRLQKGDRETGSKRSDALAERRPMSATESKRLILQESV